jgi:hypothetical protein
MGDVATLVSGIEYKVRKLMEQHGALQEEYNRLSNELTELKRINTDQKQTIIQLEEKINVLKLAGNKDADAESITMKAKISELLREIDKCIGLLNT